jgi:putative two-component system response regulator
MTDNGSNSSGRLQIATATERRILVVDDAPAIRTMLTVFLTRLGFEVESAPDAESALELLKVGGYFLVITDVGMPGLSGLELLSEIQAITAHMNGDGPDVIIVTGRPGEKVAVEALRRGAYDYFAKPFSFDAMTFTVKRLLERRRLGREAREYHTLMVRMEAADEHAHQAMQALVEAVYAKDNYTRGHMERVGMIAAKVGRYMGKDEREVELLYRAGTLHDIGKIGTPDAILNKPSALTDLEWDSIRLHPIVGSNILAPISALSDVCGPVRCHHERWDGTGYPDKIGGGDIPELARILAIADVCDALYSDRAYRVGLPESTVREIILSGKGNHFEPVIVDALMDLVEQGEIFEPLASSRSNRKVSDEEVKEPC